MTNIVFKAWPKIARFRRDITITEKIDGTNGAIGIVGDVVYAQSRNRIVELSDNHFGFAQWVEQNREALKDTLGQGLHFGEWWGAGIGRGYDKHPKTFSLFNTSRWNPENTASVPGLTSVPVLWSGNWDGPGMSDSAVEYSLASLRLHGSQASPGFMRPEGIVIFHSAGNVLFKVTLEHDDVPKGTVKVQKPMVSY